MAQFYECINALVRGSVCVDQVNGLLVVLLSSRTRMELDDVRGGRVLHVKHERRPRGTCLLRLRSLVDNLGEDEEACAFVGE